VKNRNSIAKEIARELRSGNKMKCICDGKETILFRGRGLNLQCMLCPQVGTGDHKTMEECEEIFKRKMLAHMPTSGRFA
jgi:hypothetical protein